jgi:hypothetical protein
VTFADIEALANMFAASNPGENVALPVKLCELRKLLGEAKVAKAARRFMVAGAGVSLEDENAHEAFYALSNTITETPAP